MCAFLATAGAAGVEGGRECRRRCQRMRRRRPAGRMVNLLHPRHRTHRVAGRRLRPIALSDGLDVHGTVVPK